MNAHTLPSAIKTAVPSVYSVLVAGHVLHPSSTASEGKDVAELVSIKVSAHQCLTLVLSICAFLNGCKIFQ